MSGPKTYDNGPTSDWVTDNFYALLGQQSMAAV
jgi:hypothetical protein